MTIKAMFIQMLKMIRCQEYFINFLLKTLAIPTPTIRGSFSNMYSPAAKGYKSMQNQNTATFEHLSVNRLEIKNLQKKG